MADVMDDCIRRNDVLDLIAAAQILAGNENESLISAPDLADAVVCLPDADVRPVARGEWIKRCKSKLDGAYCCSACGYEIDIADGAITPLDMDMYFCWKCGADLRGRDVEAPSPTVDS